MFDSNKKIVYQDTLDEYHKRISALIGRSTKVEAGFTPVGTVISVMGKTAPANYLACDGSIVNIADYPILADYFMAQFGSKNYFGGDGTTTFAVPDLRGEFLRGSGKLNDQQLQAISTMRSPQEIGQYLMQGVPQNMYGQIQTNVQDISRKMK